MEPLSRLTIAFLILNRLHLLSNLNLLGSLLLFSGLLVFGKLLHCDRLCDGLLFNRRLFDFIVFGSVEQRRRVVVLGRIFMLDTIYAHSSFVLVGGRCCALWLVVGDLLVALACGNDFCAADGESMRDGRHDALPSHWL